MITAHSNSQAEFRNARSHFVPIHARSAAGATRRDVWLRRLTGTQVHIHGRHPPTARGASGLGIMSPKIEFRDISPRDKTPRGARNEDRGASEKATTSRKVPPPRAPRASLHTPRPPFSHSSLALLESLAVPPNLAKIPQIPRASGPCPQRASPPTMQDCPVRPDRARLPHVARTPHHRC